jgi:LysM repeat protein
VKVTAGQDCNAVATANNISVEQLRAFNPSIDAECSNLLADTNICISQRPTPSPAPVTCAAEERTLTVKEGDTCIKLAVEAGVTAGALQQRNNIPAECQGLQIGQQLCVPKDCPVAKVNAGEDCNAIAAANNISVDQLRTFNPSINAECTNLLADTNICIAAPMPTSAPEEKTVTVEDGDTCITLAVKAGVTACALRERNNIPEDCTGLQIGQTLQVPADCNVVKVNAGEDCNAIAAANNISVDQLRSFNPLINAECTNLPADANICVSARPS